MLPCLGAVGRPLTGVIALDYLRWLGYALRMLPIAYLFAPVLHFPR